MVGAVKFHVYIAVFTSGKNLQLFLKDLIKLTTLHYQLPVGLLAQLAERCTGIASFSGLISTTSSVVFIAARISYIRFFTAVHIYDFHISTIII